MMSFQCPAPFNSSYQLGISLALLSTVLQSTTDALAKYAATMNNPLVVMFYGGGFAALLSLTVGRLMKQGPVLRTSVPTLMAVRSFFSLSTTILYIFALTIISLAEAFVAGSTMPFMAAIVGRVLHGNPIRPSVWGAMAAGVIGVAAMFLDAMPEARIGYLYVFAGTFCGATSIVLSRQVYRHERNPFGMVFWPNMALCLGTGIYLFTTGTGFHAPMFWPILPYAVFLFLIRLLATLTSRLLLTHVQTAIYNLQFIWVVIIGAVVFSDTLTLGILSGALLLISSTLYLARVESLRNHRV